MGGGGMCLRAITNVDKNSIIKIFFYFLNFNPVSVRCNKTIYKLIKQILLF